MQKLQLGGHAQECISGHPLSCNHVNLSHTTSIMKKEKKRQHQMQQSSSNKEEKNKNSWPDLPQQVIKHIARSSYMNTRQISINFGSVTKSWRSPTRQRCDSHQIKSSQLHVLDPFRDSNNARKATTNNQEAQQLCTILFQYFYWYRSRRGGLRPSPSWKYFTSCSNDYLVATTSSPSKISLINPMSNYWWDIPNWGVGFPFKCAAISSSPYEKHSYKNRFLMVVTGISHPALMFYNLKAEGQEWIMQDCKLVEPHFSKKNKRHCMEFTNVIGFRGKFYALSSQGTLVVIDQEVDDPADIKISALGKTRAVPSLPSRQFRECLIQSDDDILLVFLVSTERVDVVDCVEIFKLHPGDLSWIKMESLEGKALFLGNDCCISISACEVGYKRNCVYFRQREVGGWWVYDVEAGCISAASTDVELTKLPELAKFLVL